uniref:Uncharacterized protein n=1 Tax=Avena sativa TaxID=4498 RepID=A0ACD6AG33_AVESA
MEGDGRKTKTVCVTGAGGFVASWLVQRLLSSGDYTVHGTVRDPSDPKNGHLKALVGAEERLRLFKADVLDYASVASAVAGCDGVFHVASPVPAAKSQNPEVDVLAPAVKGTQNVLNACHEAKVRRVVVVNTEIWYCLSKTLAEREALAYAEKTGLDVVTVCPPLVLGPLLQPVANTSSLVLINLLKGDGEAVVHDKARNVVDVRDLADALVLVYENPEASGRYICSAYRKRLSEMVEIARSFCPDLNRPKKFVEAEDDDRMMRSRKMEALGWKFRAVEECLRDSVEAYKAAGFL